MHCPLCSALARGHGKSCFTFPGRMRFGSLLPLHLVKCVGLCACLFVFCLDKRGALWLIHAASPQRIASCFTCLALRNTNPSTITNNPPLLSPHPFQRASTHPTQANPTRPSRYRYHYTRRRSKQSSLTSWGTSSANTASG